MNLSFASQQLRIATASRPGLASLIIPRTARLSPVVCGISAKTALDG